MTAIHPTRFWKRGEHSGLTRRRTFKSRPHLISFQQSFSFAISVLLSHRHINMADKAGWYRFLQVTKYVRDGHKLYRSSAPNYVESGGDKSQKLTSASVQYLTSQKIDNIISFNQYSYTDSEKQLLKNAKIEYLHLPVVDFSAPTLDQLHKAIASYKATNHKSTLFHCGYGHGRTGTGVTALQLDSTSGKNPPESEWKSVNHVEKDEQVEVLRKLKKEY